MSREGAGLTPEDTIRFCDEQITHYKAPEHMRIVDDLPVTVIGKPQKFVMRDRMVTGWWRTSTRRPILRESPILTARKAGAMVRP